MRTLATTRKINDVDDDENKDDNNNNYYYKLPPLQPPRNNKLITFQRFLTMSVSDVTTRILDGSVCESAN